MKKIIQISALALLCGAAMAHSMNTCSKQNKVAQYLFVQQADHAKFVTKKNKSLLIVNDLNVHMLYFSDAPQRRAGKTTAAKFIKDWQNNGNKAINIAVSGNTASGEEIKTVVNMTDAKIENGRLIMHVTAVGKKSLPTLSLNNINMFIDDMSCGYLC